MPGLQIIAARVAKPDIPRKLQEDFVRVEEEISKLKVVLIDTNCVFSSYFLYFSCCFLAFLLSCFFSFFFFFL